MKLAIAVTAALAFSAEGLVAGRNGRRSTTAVTDLRPFYHSTKGIRDELVALASRCNGMELKTVQGTSDNGDSTSIDVVTIRAPGSSPVNKNFLLFGEHARELISPESGLHLVKTLCGETDLSSKAAEVLQSSEFQIVVNGNPSSRQKVEQGNFCLRVNPNGVDLNRNWDEKWQANAASDPDDTNPGAMPFSEPETRAFRSLVSEYKPTTFLTVHSGTLGMYMPWAFDMEHLAQRNQPEMMAILQSLDKDHCECPFGAAGREVGYSCPGTCLDYVYDRLQTPYAFAFEIYVGRDYQESLRQRWQEKMSAAGALLQTNSHLGHQHFRDFFAERPSSFVQVRSEHVGMSDMECFEQFNPQSEDEYKTTVENWSSAYLDMADMIATNLKKGNSTMGMVKAHV